MGPQVVVKMGVFLKLRNSTGSRSTSSDLIRPTKRSRSRRFSCLAADLCFLGLNTPLGGKMVGVEEREEKAVKISPTKRNTNNN